MNSPVLRQNGGFTARRSPKPPKLRGSRPGVVVALFATLLFIAGCGSSNTKTIAPTPTFTPTAGSYSAAQNVTVSDANQNAVLYCTNDGSVPTASSAQCANPIKVAQSQTIKAIAIVPGMDASEVATASFAVTASAVAPAITAIGPVNGPTSGQTSVTIAGTGFTGATSVSFGTVAASSFTVNSATSISAISPQGTGAVHVTVVNSSGVRSATSTADLFTYDTVPAPAVTGVVPSSGPAAGGTSVAITGSNFSGATAVYFGTIAAASYTVNSATGITAIAPAGSGTVDITVVTGGGTSATSSADQFTYLSAPAVTGVNPSAGPAAGGTIVNISGTGFTSATAVNFGTAAASSYIVNSATSITAVSPIGSGTVNVKVLTPYGLSSSITADEFTYIVAAPAVASVSPTSGSSSGGTTVTITGEYFKGATGVYFGTTPATSFTVNSATSITAVSPMGDTAEYVTVVGPGGTSDAGSAELFTYILPTLSGKVLSGPASNGTPLGATVYLYAAGTAGYGSTPIELATATANSTTGAFSGLSYDCMKQSAPGDQLYLVAQGSRSETVLMTALGTCSSVAANYPSGVTINEATTIASAYALAQFASLDSTSGIDIGAPATATTCTEADGWKSKGTGTCNYIGLRNAFAKVNNLVDLPSGKALSMTPYYTSNPGSGEGYNYSQAPQARVHALANALASCSNPTNGDCSGLFSATKAGTTEPKDTLQAALNIAQNPGGNNGSNNVNVSAIYTQASAASSFTPTLTAAPTDWTLAIVYQGAGLAFGKDGDNNGAGHYMPTGIAIDANGNVWLPIACASDVADAYNAVTGDGNCGYGNGAVAVFSNLGVPLSPSATSATIAGGYTGSNSILNPQSLAIDQNGYAWIGNYPASDANTAGSVTVLDVNGNVKFGSPYTNSKYLMAPTTNGIAVDKNNNVWVSSNNVADPNDGQFVPCGLAGILQGGSILPLSVTNNIVVPVTSNGKDLVADYFSDNSSCPGSISIDQSGNLWTNDDGNATGEDYYGAMDWGDTYPAGTLALLSTLDGSLTGGPYYKGSYRITAPTAIDSSANAWFPYYTTSVVIAKETNLAGTTGKGRPSGSSAGSDPVTYLPTGMKQLFFSSPVAVDGNSNVWLVGENTSNLGTLFQINNVDSTVLSPSLGFQGFDGTGLNPIGQISLGVFDTAVDNSGNLWVASGIGANGKNYIGKSAGATLSEFIGIAAPVQTPLVNGLINGNNLGTKP